MVSVHALNFYFIFLFLSELKNSIFDDFMPTHCLILCSIGKKNI